MPTDPEFEPTIQARFQVTLPDGTIYTDALVMPRSEYNALTNAQIRNLRQQRVAAYLKAVEDARSAPQPTRAELWAERLARRESLVEQLAAVDAEIAQER